MNPKGSARGLEMTASQAEQLRQAPSSAGDYAHVQVHAGGDTSTSSPVPTPKSPA